MNTARRFGVWTSGKRGRGRPRIAIVRHSGYPSDMHIRRDVLALRDAGFDVDLICDHESGRPLVERVDGITVLRIPPKHRRGGLWRYVYEYSAFPLLAGAVVAFRSIAGRYRWVEINNMPDWLIVAALLPRLLGSRVTLYSREDMPRLFASDYDLPPTHPVVRLLSAAERVCGHLADRIIATHEAARRDLIQLGLPGDKIVVVPNAPDEEAFFARLPECPPDNASPTDGDGTFRLVTHGTLARRYGIETLLEAIAIVRGCIPSFHLEIIGDGEYRPELEALTDRLGVRPHVTFTGFVPSYEDVAPRLVRADLGVVTLWTDFQLCNKLVDYLALGIPAITTESAALRPYLKDSDVHYVEPKNAQALADAIVSLYHDPVRRRALGAAGHTAYREHFAWERARHDYLAVYDVPAARRPDMDATTSSDSPKARHSAA